MSVFELKGYRRRFDSFDLEADLSLRAEDRLALLGPSGCGKTTVLRSIAGLGRGAEESGEVWIHGREVGSLAPEKREVGLVFQDYALFPSLDVWGNLVFGLRARGVPRSTWEDRLRPWIERFSLKTKLKSDITSLSGGEKQRVALVRTAVTEPKVFLLDEPFSALDAELRSEASQAIQETQIRLKVPLVFVTHDAADVSRLGTLVSRVELLDGSSGRKLHRFRMPEGESKDPKGRLD